MWRPCRGSPSRAKFVLSLHTKGPSYESPGRCSEVGLFSSGRSPVVWFFLCCCHKLKLPPLPSTHSAPTKLGWQRNWICRGASRPENPVTCFPWRKVVAPATKGGAAEGSIKHSPLNQPALWAEPGPPRAPARRRLEPGRRRRLNPLVYGNTARLTVCRLPADWYSWRTSELVRVISDTYRSTPLRHCVALFPSRGRKGYHSG